MLLLGGLIEACHVRSSEQGITAFQFVPQEIACQLLGELDALQHGEPRHGQAVIAGSFGQ